MITTLRIFFFFVLGSMLAVTTWASIQVPLWAIPPVVGGHPWFIATLFDAYWGFFTFYAWLCYKETSWLARILWFCAIVLLGNIAMAAYGLAVVLRLPVDAKPAEILLRGQPVTPLLPATLTVAILLVCSPAFVH